MKLWGAFACAVPTGNRVGADFFILTSSALIIIMLSKDETLGARDVERYAWDRGRRKEEIARAFWCLKPSAEKNREVAYKKALSLIGIATPRDLEILMSVLQDAIMKANREGLPTVQLEAFRDWLFGKRLDR